MTNIQDRTEPQGSAEIIQWCERHEAEVGLGDHSHVGCSISGVVTNWQPAQENPDD